jgi:UDP-glucuronate 4-epimerase
MRVLVTGAGGFVGLHLVRRFAAGGAEVDALVRRPPDAATEAFLGDHAARTSWRFGDVTDRDACDRLVAERRPDVVVHAAAVTFTGDQERAEPARVFDVNAGGTLNALEAARRHGAGTFVYVSSGGLYGAAPPVPALDETAEMRPVNMYAVSKIASEHLCGRYAALSELRVRVGRLGTAYGPMERASGSRSNLSAVQQIVSAAADGAGAAGAGAAGAPLRVAGAEIARDFVHIDDVAEAFWQLAVVPNLPELVYNVGAPVSEPLAVALDVVAAEVPGFSWRPVAAGEAADLRQVSAQARAAMDVTRLMRDTSWRPRYPLAEGVHAYLAWRRDHVNVVALAEATD